MEIIKLNPFVFKSHKGKRRCRYCLKKARELDIMIELRCSSMDKFFFHYPRCWENFRKEIREAKT